MCWAKAATIVVAVVLVVGIVAYNYYDVMWMSDVRSHSDMRLIGEGIYEYHAKTGKWPSKLADLSMTSPALIYPQWWADTLALDANIIVCPKNLKPDPKDNGHAILCYHSKGADAENGRMWVCWGDLRTGLVTLEELQEILARQKGGEKPMDPNLVGVWQNQNDAREIWTVRADGSLRWFYRGVPVIGISDSIVEYAYRADPSQSPAHLDLIHRGVMGTSLCIYELVGDVLHIGIASDKSGIRPKAFGPMDRYYKRVSGPVPENPR